VGNLLIAEYQVDRLQTREAKYLKFQYYNIKDNGNNINKNVKEKFGFFSR